MDFVREWRARRGGGLSTPVALEAGRDWPSNVVGIPRVNPHLTKTLSRPEQAWIGKIQLPRPSRVNSYLSRFAFTKAHRILKRSQFIAFRRSGKKIDSPYFFAAVRPNELPHCRLGITVTRKIGKAAQRNRVKRRIREYFRLNRHCIVGNWDILLIAKSGAGEIDLAQASSSLDRIFHQLGSIRND
jgi:ribonuclease P protein component